MARYNQNGGKVELHGRKRRLVAPSAIAVAMGLVTFAGMAQHSARADDQQLQLLEDQIRQLQAQIDGLKKAQAQQAAATPAVPAGTKPTVGYETSSHQFGWASADGKDTIELTGRLHLDAGGYFDYHQNNPASATPFAAGKGPEDGFNARRARLGVTGKFDGDFTYALIYDFGGGIDSGTGGINPGGIENAFITYNGFNKPTQTVPVAIDAGYIDVPWTLDEATSSNDIMFMERSSAQTAFTNAFGGNDFRSVAGVRSYKSDYWVGAYVTGPQSGAAHTGEQLNSIAYLLRATYNPIQDNDTSVHIGGNFAYAQPPKGNGNAFTFSVSDYPELRIDNTKILTTANGTPWGAGAVQHSYVLGPEIAGAYQNFFAQGEYYYAAVNQNGGANAVPNTTNTFQGGYVQASYSIGGKRQYNPTTGAYTGVIPTSPLSVSNGTWGAVELAARFDRLDLNSDLSRASAAAGTISGGDQTGVTLGVNWYLNSNVRVMFDYMHEDIGHVNSYAAGVETDHGANENALATRLQVAW